MNSMQIRIDAYDFPGRHFSNHPDVHVGVQRRGDNADILDPVPADVASASWQVDTSVSPIDAGFDIRGPYVQGKPGDRFIYLSWGTLVDGTFTMFGRSKLLLSAVDGDTLGSAVKSGLLVGHVGLVDERGRVRLAAVRPPGILWSAG